MNTFKKQHTSN